ncbi:MAG: hypothetical protein KKC37_16640 [Proteobacteria bacterium]|nr:hypothetical protein [Pseudomonadota bacterium]
MVRYNMASARATSGISPAWATAVTSSSTSGRMSSITSVIILRVWSLVPAQPSSPV